MSTHFKTLPLDNGSHHSGHGGGHGSFVDSLLRGFAWRTGSDVANSLFHLAPMLIIVAVLITLLVVGTRRLRSRRT